MRLQRKLLKKPLPMRMPLLTTHLKLLVIRLLRPLQTLLLQLLLKRLSSNHC